jgi:hypothetical protein
MYILQSIDINNCIIAGGPEFTSFFCHGLNIKNDCSYMSNKSLSFLEYVWKHGVNCIFKKFIYLVLLKFNIIYIFLLF